MGRWGFPHFARRIMSQITRPACLHGWVLELMIPPLTGWAA